MLEEPDFESEEDQAIFAANVFSELAGYELHLATHPQGSHVLQKLLMIAGETHLRVYMTKLDAQYSKLMVHHYGSYVCQTLLQVVGVTLKFGPIYKDVSDSEFATAAAGVPEEEINDYTVTPTDLPSLSDLFALWCQQLTDHWATIMSHRSGSHVVRTMLLILANKTMDQLRTLFGGKEKSVLSGQSTDGTGIPLHQLLAPGSTPAACQEQCAQVLAHLANCTDSDNDSGSLQALAICPNANPVLQLVLVLQGDQQSHTNKGSLMDKVLGGFITDPDTVNKDLVHTLVTDRIGSHLIERIFPILPESLHYQLYVSVFRHHLADFCAHPTANYVVQELIKRTKTPTQATVIVDELLPCLPSMLSNRYYGLLCTAVSLCATVQVRCQEMGLALFKALEISDAKVSKSLIIPIIANLTPQSTYLKPQKRQNHTPKNQNVKYSASPTDTGTVHGWLILQHLLHFPSEYANRILNSFLAQSVETRLAWATHSSGSRLVEALLARGRFPLKEQHRIVRGFKGQFVALVTDKLGSFIFEQCWAISSIDLKKAILLELVEHEDNLKVNYYGKICLEKCQLQSFKRSQEDWLKRQEKIDQKRSTLTSFLDELETKDGPQAQAANLTEMANSEAASLGLLPLAHSDEQASGDEFATMREAADELMGSETPMANGEDLDEIDELFKTKKPAEQQSAGQAPSAEPSALESLPLPPPLSTTHGDAASSTGDLAAVLSAISSTKKRKKSKAVDSSGPIASDKKRKKSKAEKELERKKRRQFK
ncbi:Nucleolar protein 9 [Dimargaris xerosporica]|nr:Nucleolar protein 9 [Dimargaris xerosporica]